MIALFAGVPVRDLAIGRAWYEQLFGRPADVVAQDTDVLWRVRDGGWMDSARAG